jgi:hypothetical protein
MKVALVQIQTPLPQKSQGLIRKFFPGFRKPDFFLTIATMDVESEALARAIERARPLALTKYPAQA